MITNLRVDLRFKLDLVRAAPARRLYRQRAEDLARAAVAGQPLAVAARVYQQHAPAGQLRRAVPQLQLPQDVERGASGADPGANQR